MLPHRMDAEMHKPALFLLVAFAAGCSSERPFKNRNIPPTAIRGNSVPLRPLAIPEAKPGTRALGGEEPALLIPPPPQLVSLTRGEMTLAMPAIPAPPDAEVAATPDKFADLKRILKTAQDQFAGIDAFEARLTRREVLDGKEGPQEVIRFKFRKRPLSVHMKWIGAEGQGRELLFVEGKHEGKLHVLTARGDMFPLSPPTRLALDPESDMVRSKSRHSIRDAGLGSSIRQLGKALAAAERNPALESRIAYRGLVERPEYRVKLEAVEETVAPGAESLLPRGGRRTTFYDPTPGAPSHGLPVIVSTRDHAGREVEYYCFDRFLHPIVLDDGDFDPERLLKRK